MTKLLIRTWSVRSRLGVVSERVVVMFRRLHSTMFTPIWKEAETVATILEQESFVQIRQLRDNYDK